MMYNLHKSTRVSATFFSFFLSLSSHENSSIPRKTSCKIHARAGIILVTLEFAPLSLFLERRRSKEGRRDFESMEKGREELFVFAAIKGIEDVSYGDDKGR